MTDHDRDLQDAFDRAVRGEGAPPDTDHDPEAAAYEVVYTTLSEEPEGTDLPNNFAEQVADRVGLSRKPAMGWAEILLLFLIIAGAGTGLVWMPPTLAGLQQSAAAILRSVQAVSGPSRLDVVMASVLVLVLTIGLDALLVRLRRRRHSPSV